MKKVNFWKGKPIKIPKVNVKFPESKMVKQSGDLVKTGVNVAIGLTLLGAGVKAYQDITD